MNSLSHIRIVILFILIAAFICGRAEGRPEAGADPAADQWRWSTFTTESGLPSDRVEGIYETTDSIPWVLTNAGLAWFDGFRWRVKPELTRQAGAGISWVEEDYAGGLVVVNNFRIYRVTAQSVTEIPCTADSRDTLTGDINCVFPLDSRSYLVQIGGGVFKLRDGKLARVPIPGVIGLGLTSMFRSGGMICMSTSEGIFLWDRDRWVLKIPSDGRPFQIHRLVALPSGEVLAWIKAPFRARGLWEWTLADTPRLISGEGSELIQTVDASPDGTVLAVYESGQVRVRAGGEWTSPRSIPVLLQNMLTVKYRANGDLWIGTEAGIRLFRKSSRRWEYWKHPFPNLKNTVHALLRDHEGLIWIGTAKGVEVRRSDGSVVRTVESVEGRSLDIVTGLCEDRNHNIWISSGSQFEGAYRWDGRRWKHFGAAEGLDAQYIHRIYCDRRGDLWFLGLAVTKERPDQPGAFLLKDGRFTAWSRQHGLRNNRIYTFLESHDGAYWFGTSTGLFRWKSGSWTEFPDLHGTMIFTLAADSSGNIWFGANSSNAPVPFGRIRADDRVEIVPLNDAGVRTQIWDLACGPDGTLWIATRGGEGVVSYRNGLWASLDLSAGLNSLKLWPILPDRDRLYAGTDGNGVNIFRFDEAGDPPPLVEAQAPVIDEKTVQIRWAAYPWWGAYPVWDLLSRYRIDDSTWSPWGKRSSVKWNGLDAGGHHVRIQTKGIFGTYDTNGVSVDFSIAPSFYLRPVAAIPTALLLIIVGYLGTTLIVRKRRYAAGIRHSESNLRMITSATSSAIVISQGGAIRYVNPSAEGLTEYTRDQLLQRDFAELIDPEYRSLIRTDEPAGSQKTGEQQPRAEIRMTTGSGRRKWLDCTWGSIEFEGAPALLLTAIDITERKTAEEMLLTYQDQLRSLATDLSKTEERERRRMATYLHDMVSQSLAVCQSKLSNLHLQDAAASEKETLKAVHSFLAEALESLQTVTFELSPPILYELGFADAIDWLVEQMAKKYGLEVSADLGSGRSIPEPGEEVRGVIFSAIREVLVNVVKHSGTNRAGLTVRGEGDGMLIVVTDSGSGFDPSAATSRSRRGGGFGLFNIRERLSFIGGHLGIQSSPGHGTTVTITVPRVRAGSCSVAGEPTDSPGSSS